MSYRILTIIAVLSFVVGCSTRRGPTVESKAPTEETSPIDSSMGSLDKATSDVSVGTDWGTVPSLEVAYFNTDRAELTEPTRQVLKRNGAVLKALVKEVPGLEVRIEGHCDERATLEYNMALGERRATNVRDYYVSLGIRKGTLSTVSYGEERPLCSQSEESCWQQNRRAVTVIRSKTPIRVPLNKLPK